MGLTNVAFKGILALAPVGVLLLAILAPFGFTGHSLGTIPALADLPAALLPTLIAAAAGSLYAGLRKRKLWGGNALQVLGAAGLTTLAGALLGGLVYSLFLLGAHANAAAHLPEPWYFLRMVLLGPFLYGAIALLMAATSIPAILWWIGSTVLAARIARLAAPPKD